MRTVPISYEDDKRVRLLSATGSVIVHILMLVILSLILVWRPPPPEIVELDWGSSGAPNQRILESERQPQQQPKSSQPQGAAAKKKVDLPKMRSSSDVPLPAAKKPQAKTSAGKQQTRTETVPSPVTRRRRAVEGVAGGAGKSTGYSIEWSGAGSRRLLSGRIPEYPKGTDKEMPVLLRFTVLPDGSVTNIIPVRRSDELLEREAISALRTWRFDQLPPQYEQKPQVGTITFNFILE